MNYLRNVVIGILVFIGVLGIGYLLLRRPTQTVSVSDSVVPTAGESIPKPTERTYEIVELLPPDGIPAIDNPEFYSVEESDLEYDPNEIVNDEVGDRKIAVTW